MSNPPYSSCEKAPQRPLWAQLLIFLGIEAVFYACLMLSSGYIIAVLGDALYSAFGPDAGFIWIKAVTTAASMAWCLLRLTLHWLLTFPKRGPYCWTSLPIWLWYLATQIIGDVLHRVRMGLDLPILTHNRYVYPVVHAVLFLLSFAALAVMVHSLRHGRRPMAGAMLAVQLILTLCTDYVASCNAVVQMEHLLGGWGQAGDAAFNAAMAPLETLTNVMYILQITGMFFIMKKWVFLTDAPVQEEV